MTYSGGPHIWIPRRLSGLGQAPPSGRYLINQATGTAEQAVRDAKTQATAYVTSVTSGAQGYITQQAADAARNAYRQATGNDPPWIPTDPKQVGPWAKQQAILWATSQVQQGIDLGRRAYEDKMGIMAPYGQALHESDIAQWALDYLAGHPDLLTHPTEAGAMAMAQAFIMTNSDAIGLPPEYIAASRLIRNFPDTIENAEQWGIILATSYLSQFGVPIVTSTNPKVFLDCCGRAAIAQIAPGIPYGFCEATIGALSDGSVSRDEAEGIVVGACSYIGAAVGQMFGIPAPIGAMLSQIIAAALYPIVADALGFGPSDSEKLNAAQASAAKAAAAATVVCTDLARALWLQYQHYWDGMESNIQALVLANAEWLYPNGCSPTNGSGIRVFPEAVPGSNTLDIVLDVHGAAIHVGGPTTPLLHYPRPIARGCSVDVQGPNAILGCPYLAYGGYQIARRSGYPQSLDELTRGGLPAITSSGPGCDALSALAFWNARRYVTPFQAYYESRGAPQGTWLLQNTNAQSQFGSQSGPSWDSVLKSDDEYLQEIGRVQVSGSAGESVGDCMTPAWGQCLSGSLRQAAAASALVQRDIARTISSATTQYELSKNKSATDQRGAARAAAARAASFRYSIDEAKRRGARRADLINYSLLAAGSAAIAGWAFAKRRPR